MSDEYLLVICSCPDNEVPENLARNLVEKKLAACVNIGGQVTSIYSWQGEVDQDQERLLFIKTRKAVYPQLEREIIRRHPYELPEVIALPIKEGHKPYFAWITECTS